MRLPYNGWIRTYSFHLATCWIRVHGASFAQAHDIGECGCFTAENAENRGGCVWSVKILRALCDLSGEPVYERRRFRLAACAPFFPRAVRVFFGRCAIVRFRLAADAAFLMFFLAALFCFCELIMWDRHPADERFVTLAGSQCHD
jgi:hypothetical protein